MKNVEIVVKNKLCTGCGACYGVCPNNSINMEMDRQGNMAPKIDNAQCINCSLCLKVCPGSEFDYIHFMKKYHGKLPDDIAIGPVRSTHAGCTNNKEVLQQAQSGGIISELLIYGIENKLIDGAVVTGYSQDDPFNPIVYIARSRQEILKATGSKYCSVPAAAIIKQLREVNGKYAFVGTPCQIQGMRKAEELIPGLEDKIALYIGLHCLGVYNNYYIDQLLSTIKRPRNSIKEFKYREKQQNENLPASTVVFRTKDGEEFKLEGKAYRLYQRPHFTNWRCQMCFDKLNDFSDISCGDCRIPTFYKEQAKEGTRTGLSDIIVRTKRGEEILRRMITEKILNIQESKQSDIITSTKVLEKKVGTKYAYKINRMLLCNVPEYGIHFDISNNAQISRLREFVSLLSMGHYYACHSLIKFKWFRKILSKMSPRALGILNKAKTNYTSENKIKDSSHLLMTIDTEDKQKGE